MLVFLPPVTTMPASVAATAAAGRL